jgi:hypothetical protein
MSSKLIYWCISFLEWLTTTETHLFVLLVPAPIQVTRFPPPPMWEPQLWQGQGVDPTHPSTFTSPTHVTNQTDPINFESEAEHSVQEVNSPTKSTDTPGTVRRTKEQNFKPDEDLLLCKTWLEISSDPVISTGQRKEGLWARIEKRYNELKVSIQ